MPSLRRDGETMMTLNKVADWLTRRYLQTQQIQGLLGLINFLLILRLSFDSQISSYIFLPLVFMLVLVAGYITDIHFKLRKRTSKYAVDHNPPWMEQYHRIIRIEKNIEELMKHGKVQKPKRASKVHSRRNG